MSRTSFSVCPFLAFECMSAVQIFVETRPLFETHALELNRSGDCRLALVEER